MDIIPNTICPISSILKIPNTDNSITTPVLLDTSHDSQFKNTLAEVLRAATSQTQLQNLFLMKEVKLFIDNIYNVEFIQNLSDLYSESGFTTLPFDSSFFIGLLDLGGKELLKRLVLNCFYHFNSLFSSFHKEIIRSLPLIISKGYFDFLIDITIMQPEKMIDSAINQIITTSDKFGQDQSTKIAHVLSKVNYPPGVCSYFKKSDPFLLSSINIIIQLLQIRQHQTMSFVKIFLRQFLNKASQSPEIFQSPPHQNFFIKVINSQYHFKAFCFLHSLIQQQPLLRKTSPFDEFFKMIFLQYPPRIVQSLKRHFADICKEPLEEGVSFIDLNASSKPTIRCFKCLECFTSISSVIQHWKLCQNPTFDGIRIQPTNVFEDKWNIVKSIFFNSKVVKDLFVKEQNSTNELELMNKWVSLCDLQKVLLKKKLIKSDWEKSDVCTFHREHMTMPCDDFNIFERLNEKEKRSTYIKDVYTDADDEGNSIEEISVDDIPEFLQGFVMKKRRGDDLEMFVTNEIEEDQQAIEDAITREEDEVNYQLQMTRDKEIRVDTQSSQNTNKSQCNERSMEIENIEIGDDTTNDNQSSMDPISAHTKKATFTMSEISVDDVPSESNR
ncbi:hypothetical protein EDI_160000 [Entamoeba dispar SAW760]|uniref:Uncharacterized protein n=1 Tax=Entamoeba dispar (strain ATCC PRA-260 / SAW760) TaxID=370354 RepID=B0ELZ0_ENTDS|nr:uncharacterized protein EDI_160000 [Entamoeba dispar SAW760]EDR24446.1 hypothetical protein EDI_160000 [Entamoeba dispar SAW760]|eukprot:EDR24446.1 hypothetical protein EDI_160000 [Entamoeba dispar SAW760]